MMQYQPGDMFLTTGSKISKVINTIQTWWAPDGRSKYTHAGIITSYNGNTIEMKIKGAMKLHIDDLQDHPLLIARHDQMTHELFQEAYSKLKIDKGRAYPIWRLFLYLLPPLTRLSEDTEAVCSELVSLFLFYAGLIPYWRGISPDGLHDMFRQWKRFEIIHES